MLGSRVFLLPHQIDTIMNVVNERESRFMLADEVGLGKTIEASVILKYLKSKNHKMKCLIIVPDSLIYLPAPVFFPPCSSHIPHFRPGG